MYCRNCGTRMNDNDKFCNSCGSDANSSSSVIEKDIKNHPTSRNIKRNIIISIISVLVLISVFVFVFMSPDSVDTFISNINSENYQKAQQVYDKDIFGHSEKEIRAQDYLKQQINDTVDAYVNEIMDYNMAIIKIENIDNIKVLKKLIIADAYQKVNLLNESRTAYQTAQDYIKNSKFIDAIKMLKKVIITDKNYDNAQRELQDSIKSYKSTVLVQAEDLMNKSEHVNAIDLLQDSLKELPNDPDLTAKLSIIQSNYESYIIAHADQLISSKEYQKAYDIVNLAKMYIIDTTVLNKKLNEILLYTPISLTTLTPYHDNNKGSWNTQNNGKDNFGNEYGNCILFECGYGTPDPLRLIYSFNKKYEYFTGIIATPFDRSSVYDSISDDIRLRCYCDDILVYESPRITTLMKPQTIAFSLKGVDELRIEYVGGAATWNVKSLLGDPLLYGKYAE